MQVDMPLQSSSEGALLLQPPAAADIVSTPELQPPLAAAIGCSPELQPPPAAATVSSPWSPAAGSVRSRSPVARKRLHEPLTSPPPRSPVAVSVRSCSPPRKRLHGMLASPPARTRLHGLLSSPSRSLDQHRLLSSPPARRRLHGILSSPPRKSKCDRLLSLYGPSGEPGNPRRKPRWMQSDELKRQAQNREQYAHDREVYDLVKQFGTRQLSGHRQNSAGQLGQLPPCVLDNVCAFLKPVCQPWPLPATTKIPSNLLAAKPENSTSPSKAFLAHSAPQSVTLPAHALPTSALAPSPSHSAFSRMAQATTTALSWQTAPEKAPPAPPTST